MAVQETTRHLVDNDNEEVTLATIFERASALVRQGIDRDVLFEAIDAAHEEVEAYGGLIPIQSDLDYQRAVEKDD